MHEALWDEMLEATIDTRMPMRQHLAWMDSLNRGNTVMVDHDDDIGTLWLTIAPDCDWVHAHSTSKSDTRTSSQSDDVEATGTVSSPIAEKKTSPPSSGGPPDTTVAAPTATPSLQRRVPKRKKSCYVKNPGTGSSSDVTSTMPWIRCGQCKRLKRFDYNGVLQNLICQLNLTNGN